MRSLKRKKNELNKNEQELKAKCETLAIENINLYNTNRILEDQIQRLMQRNLIQRIINKSI